MNRLITIIGLMMIPLIGFCDTLDYWHIYYNDSIIAEFNSISQDLEIEFDKSKINHGDIISIRHGDDTPCIDCKFILFVRDEKKRKLRITETDEFWGKLSFDLKDLIDFGDKNDSKRYDFYYLKKGKNGYKTPMKLILQMKLKE